MSDDDKTRIIRRPLQDDMSPPPPPASGDPDETQMAGAGRGNADYTDYLPPGAGRAPAGGSPRPAVPSSPAADEGKTVLMARSGRGTGGFDPLAPAAAPKDGMADPVVGWLVIVKGPGKGNFLRLGYGWNSIGRDPGQRVALDFGDEQISRTNHSKLLYDPRSRKFTITLGDGTNPTYVCGEALLTPTELKAGDIVQIGDTELNFVPFCGPGFDWQSEPA